MAEPLRLPVAARPEDVGFSADGLGQMADWMADLVERGQIAGATTLLMRHGQVADFRTIGSARLDGDQPLSPHALFRIYSMTKPIVAVAMMMLFEEGRWSLDDPITRFLPEFEGQPVYTGVQADGSLATEPARRAPTMRELMSHTSGLGYGLFDVHPVERAYRQAGVLTADSLDDLARRAAKIPLLFQPGNEWFYSVGSDLQGLIVERVTGQSLGAFLQSRIFGPLDMVDTAFRISSEGAERLVTLYADDSAGRLKPATHAFDIPVHDVTAPIAMESGGGGLVSTAVDYARFAQMILNGGALDGVRLLAAETVTLMATNTIPDTVLATSNPLRLLPFNPAFGFGLGFSIVRDPQALGLSEGRGTLAWGGGGGTWIWVDPENDVVFVGLIQRVADPVSQVFRGRARTLVYAALTHPEE